MYKHEKKTQKAVIETCSTHNKREIHTTIKIQKKKYTLKRIKHIVKLLFWKC